jgi:16S rRNA processing protein RimM
VAHAARQPAARQARGSGAQRRAPEPRYLAVGQIIGVHGVHGELKAQILTDDPSRFDLLTRVFVGPDGAEPAPYGLEGYRLHQKWILIKLEGVDDRTRAETLRGQLIQVPSEEAIPLAAGEYYEHQIIGLEVWTADGQTLGQVIEILYSPAHEVYVVQGADAQSPKGGLREILIPAIASVVLAVDLEAGRLLVELPEGLL